MADPRHWTPEQLKKLRELYPDHTAESVAQSIGRTTRSVHQKAKALGIGKSEAFMKSFLSGRIQAAQHDPRMLKTRFQKGMEPWNKGKKGYQPGGRSAETRFKAGQKPHTWMPLGSYRVNVTKSTPRLEKKMFDVPGPNHKRWIPVARLVWEEHHGPVPDGHIVIFKEPRLATTVLEEITVDKLMCISRAENARRNHPSRSNPELAKIIQLKGAITRQVNRINREHEQKS